MEMCQTCSYTQQTTDSERRRSGVRKWRMDRKRKEILSYICLAVKERMSWWGIVAGSCCLTAIELCGIIPSLSYNIYLMIWSLFAPGLPESCWFCSHHNPPGYKVRSDWRWSKPILSFPQGIIYPQWKLILRDIYCSKLAIYFSSWIMEGTNQNKSVAVLSELWHCTLKKGK